MRHIARAGPGSRAVDAVVLVQNGALPAAGKIKGEDSRLDGGNSDLERSRRVALIDHHHAGRLRLCHFIRDDGVDLSVRRVNQRRRIAIEEYLCAAQGRGEQAVGIELEAESPRPAPDLCRRWSRSLRTILRSHRTMRRW